MMEALGLLAALLLALGMGASGLAPSFAPSLGAGVLTRRRALVAYTLLVTAGALLFGSRVAKTLGGAIAPAEAFTPKVTLCVLCAVGVAMFAANAARVPQSTSWVTVVAVIVVGALDGRLQLATVTDRLLPAWLLLPVASHIVTWFVLSRVYPLRRDNLRLHERLKRRRRELRWIVIASGCYVAFAIGSNNVANIVGPLAAAGILDGPVGMLLVAPAFGLGAALLSGPADTVARGIVPLGEVTAAVCCLVVGSLLLIASGLGIPQSLVQLQAAAVFAVSRVKEESYQRMPRTQVVRIGTVWAVAPLASAALTAALLEVVP